MKGPFVVGDRQMGVHVRRKQKCAQLALPRTVHQWLGCLAYVATAMPGPVIDLGAGHRDQLGQRKGYAVRLPVMSSTGIERLWTLFQRLCDSC